MIKESPIYRAIFGSDTDKAQAKYDKQASQVKSAISQGKADTSIPTYTGSKEYQQAMQVFNNNDSDNNDSGADSTDSNSSDMGFSTASGGFIQRKNLPKANKKKRGGLASR